MRKAIFSLLISVSLVGCKDIPTTPYVLPEEIDLREGDLIFRLGRSMESRAVTSLDDQKVFSHVGILVKLDDKWVVIHAVPGESPEGAKDTIKMDPISQFFRFDRAKSGAIMRLDISDSAAKIVSGVALRYYDKKPLFDSYYDLEDTTAVYCTELIYLSYYGAGIDITEDRRHKVIGFPIPQVWPSDILNNKNLKIVYEFKD